MYALINTMSKLDKSPMPFGCVPIRQNTTANTPIATAYVSNAFRLCAYPAASSAGRNH